MSMSSEVGEVSIVSALGWHPWLLTAAERFSTCVARNRVPNSSQRAFRRHTVRSARLDSVAPPHASRAAPLPAAAHCLCFLAAGTGYCVTGHEGHRRARHFWAFLALHVHRPDFSSACGGLEMCAVNGPPGFEPLAGRATRSQSDLGGATSSVSSTSGGATAEGATAGATSSTPALPAPSPPSLPPAPPSHHRGGVVGRRRRAAAALGVWWRRRAAGRVCTAHRLTVVGAAQCVCVWFTALCCSVHGGPARGRARVRLNLKKFRVVRAPKRKIFACGAPALNRER